MPKIGQMIESKYLKQSDVESDTTVTVSKVGQKNVAREGDEPEMKWMVKFEEFSKPMVLNATNIKRLARSCGSDDTDDWTGKQAVLYVDPDIEFGGNVVGGLRIRPLPKPEQAPRKGPGGKVGNANVEDDIPF